jgi:hypothetical protein
MKAIGGRLKFKGDTKPKRKREDEATKDYAERKQSGDEVQEEDLEVVKIETGMGRITSSGTTIYGHFTAFTDQLSVGDAIIVQHPQTLVEETKAVRMVLSNTSMSVSSGFSSDLVSTTAFKFAKAPKAAKADVDEEAARKREKAYHAEKEAVGTYASDGGTMFTYRVKKEGAAGGYRIVTERTSGEVTRGDLLDMRSKKKADRHCH